MSDAFRELLKKVGSGPHTGKYLTREEMAEATRMMLVQEATPAQIGAFAIAHRMRRPTGIELAGILDTYEEMGPQLHPRQDGEVAVVLGIPYDGRSRFVPVNIITTLILAAVGCPVILHGGTTMPTKYGIPLVELWQGLGVNWEPLSLAQTQQVFQETGIGFVYLPQHFPLAHQLVPFREQIGKRPPLATAELMWSPYSGPFHLLTGYVHPPTEKLFQEALMLRNVRQLTAIKGLEGSGDLPLSRTAIVSFSAADWQTFSPTEMTLERLNLHHRDYGIEGTDVRLTSGKDAIAHLHKVIHNQPTPLLSLAIWNGGFYLWRCGYCDRLEASFEVARELLTTGKVAKTLQHLTETLCEIQAK